MKHVTFNVNPKFKSSKLKKNRANEQNKNFAKIFLRM